MSQGSVRTRVGFNTTTVTVHRPRGTEVSVGENGRKGWFLSIFFPRGALGIISDNFFSLTPMESEKKQEKEKEKEKSKKREANKNVYCLSRSLLKSVSDFGEISFSAQTLKWTWISSPGSRKMGLVLLPYFRSAYLWPYFSIYTFLVSICVCSLRFTKTVFFPHF